MITKALLFDMDGTLIEADVSSSEEVFQRVLVSLGVSRPLDDIKKAFLNAEKEAEDINLLSLFGKNNKPFPHHKL